MFWIYLYFHPLLLWHSPGWGHRLDGELEFYLLSFHDFCWVFSFVHHAMSTSMFRIIWKTSGWIFSNLLTFSILWCSVSDRDPDPDPYVFVPSGSVSMRSGSFYHQAKIVRKTLIPTVLCLLYDYLSFKNYVNVAWKRTKPKK